ncbi:MAG: hypothetical protein R2817_01430 [Flavobacteriales bacterium]
MADLENLRNALIITLSLVLLVLLFRRFREYVRERDLPQVLHAELLQLHVAYHPARLLLDLRAPEPVELQFALLNEAHTAIHHWYTSTAPTGVSTLELQLPELVDGTYFLEMRTNTQRTVRQFRLLQR